MTCIAPHKTHVAGDHAWIDQHQPRLPNFNHAKLGNPLGEIETSGQRLRGQSEVVFVFCLFETDGWFAWAITGGGGYMF